MSERIVVTLPNPDDVLGVEIVEKPFNVNRQPRWESKDVQPKPKTEHELEVEMKGPHDLG